MASKGYRLTASTGIHKGDREYQQDQIALIAHPRVSGCVLGVVADGMGGRSGGRKASDQVMLTAKQLFERYSPDHDDASALLTQIVQEAHIVIKLTAISSEQEPHSTLAAFLMTPKGDCAWIHAGDSRIYHFHDGQLVKRTRDHSYVQVLIDRGQITEAQANVHPQGNILLGCLGMTTTPPPIDPYYIPKMEPGDLLMACSDGLWHYFSPEELASVLYAQPPRDAVEILVGEARRRARGTGDNISIVVLKFDPLPATTA